MSLAEVYITTGLHNMTGSLDPVDRTPAVIRGQITQFTNLKIAIPRKGIRTADLTVNLLSSELSQFYTSDDPNFQTYKNFLYIKWRGHIVFWGPILIKEVDFEGHTMTLHAKDRGASLAASYFKIGDHALDGSGKPGARVWPFASSGLLPVSLAGIQLCLDSASNTEDTRIMSSDDLRYPPFIPLGIVMGSGADFTTGPGHFKIEIHRGQEIWRTMMDIADRTDGPLIELIPKDISDGHNFATCHLYGPYYRNNISSTVKFHYNTGLRNIRNLQPVTGGGVITRVNSVTSDGRWNVYSLYFAGMEEFGIWAQWETVDYNIPLDSTGDEATNSLGVGHGDAVLDAYGVPLVSVTIILQRDDQVGIANQFFFLEDFQVADIVEIAGARGPESFNGHYVIDEMRLEQESDNTGQMRQAIDVIPMKDDTRTYMHTRTRSFPDSSTPS